jgi:plastocyanin
MRTLSRFGIAASLLVSSVASAETVTGTVKVLEENGKAVTGVEVVVYVVGPPDQPGKEVVAAKIEQTQDRKFVPDLVAITTNEKVAFPNTGLTVHNVFSPKPKFDLGSFEKGKTKDYAFKDYKGTAEIYCNIHPEMAATVVVLPNPYHARVDPKTGAFTIKDVPVGKWKLYAYTRRVSAPSQVGIEVKAKEGATGVALEIKRGPETKHLNKYGEKYKDGKSYP